VKVEEHLVLYHRPGNSPAEVVVSLPPLLPVEEASGIQGVVLEVIVGGPVPCIPTGFADHAENVTTAAILRGEGRRIDLQFGYVLEGDCAVIIGAVRHPDRGSVNQVAGVKRQGAVDGHADSGVGGSRTPLARLC